MSIRARSRRLFIGGGVLAVVACATVAFHADRLGAETVAPDADARTLTCEPGARIPAASGVLLNNAWGAASAGKAPWRQCLQSREREGRLEVGWSWQWPSKDSLYAYPELLIGRSPWNVLASNDARFPRALQDIKSMRIDYDFESRHRGKKNLAVEFWLTDPALAAAGPSPQSIRAELMVWTDASPGLESKSDPPAEAVTIDGQRWRVRVRKDWGDGSGGSAHRWLFITYEAERHATQARYDARRILQHAIDRGWVEPGDWVEGVEAGNEIVSGSGSTWIRRFDVTVE